MACPLFILGATAIGKSEVALQLAEQTGAAILVLDAMQVYRGLEIGVGKPTAEERQRVPHVGIDLVDWTESFDVARYVQVATSFLREIERPVIICGGTGLYFQALTQGLCDVPAAPLALREELALLSLTELQERLRRSDPGICANLDMRNPRRIQRAIECIETTGRSLLAWQQETPPPPVTQFQAVWLQRPPEILRERINRRVHNMLRSGWLTEVAQLLQTSGEEKLAQCPAIGYRELMDVCLQRLTLERAEETIVVQTRQYAKRQVTWFKRAEGVVPLMVGDSLAETCQRVRAVWQGQVPL